MPGVPGVIISSPLANLINYCPEEEWILSWGRLYVLLRTVILSWKKLHIFPRKTICSSEKRLYCVLKEVTYWSEKDYVLMRKVILYVLKDVSYCLEEDYMCHWGRLYVPLRLDIVLKWLYSSESCVSWRTSDTNVRSAMQLDGSGLDIFWRAIDCCPEEI